MLSDYDKKRIDDIVLINISTTTAPILSTLNYREVLPRNDTTTINKNLKNNICEIKTCDWKAIASSVISLGLAMQSPDVLTTILTSVVAGLGLFGSRITKITEITNNQTMVIFTMVNSGYNKFRASHAVLLLETNKTCDTHNFKNINSDELITTLRELGELRVVDCSFHQKETSKHSYKLIDKVILKV